jgi:hypothetical protein
MQGRSCSPLQTLHTFKASLMTALPNMWHVRCEARFPWGPQAQTDGASWVVASDAEKSARVSEALPRARRVAGSSSHCVQPRTQAPPPHGAGEGQLDHQLSAGGSHPTPPRSWKLKRKALLKKEFSVAWEELLVLGHPGWAFFVVTVFHTPPQSSPSHRAPWSGRLLLQVGCLLPLRQLGPCLALSPITSPPTPTPQHPQSSGPARSSEFPGLCDMGELGATSQGATRNQERALAIFFLVPSGETQPTDTLNSDFRSPDWVSGHLRAV